MRWQSSFPQPSVEGEQFAEDDAGQEFHLGEIEIESGQAALQGQFDKVVRQDRQRLNVEVAE